MGSKKYHSLWIQIMKCKVVIIAVLGFFLTDVFAEHVSLPQYMIYYFDNFNEFFSWNLSWRELRCHRNTHWLI